MPKNASPIRRRDRNLGHKLATGAFFAAAGYSLFVIWSLLGGPIPPDTLMPFSGPHPAPSVARQAPPAPWPSRSPTAVPAPPSAASAATKHATTPSAASSAASQPSSQGAVPRGQ